VVVTTLEADLINQGWTALRAEAGGLPSDPPGPVTVSGATDALPSTFCVAPVATASVATALLAAAALAGQRGGRSAPTVALDRGHVADAVRSERFFSGPRQTAGAGFAPLSRFWAASDGWVRTHANYPWHRRALVGALGASEEAEAVAAAIAALPALEVEDRVFAAGGIATAVRSLDTWQAHPQGMAVAAEPLISHRMVANSAPRRRAPADLPLSGVRVLDLTRVIAGPVCTRFLGALGADVLRLDPPRHGDMASGAVGDTLLAKRSALLDLADPQSVTVLHALLAETDVIVSGYRPGALDRFGLDEETLTQRHRGIVAVYLDAWGHSGPWSGRRGFDSVVQGPTGIADGESRSPSEPGALPCQLLDHGTGYLAAAAAIDGLHRQAVGGGTHVRRLSLARTALWLTAQGLTPVGTSARAAGPDARSWLVEVDDDGPVSAVAPPGSLGDRPLRWPGPPAAYGLDPPRWSTTAPPAAG
jgi:CoA transferase family III